MVVAELPDDSGIVTKRDDSVYNFTRIRSLFVWRNALAENLGVKAFVLLHPRGRLSWGSFVRRAEFILLGQKALRSSNGGSMTGQAKNDGRLVGAIERGK